MAEGKIRPIRRPLSLPFELGEVLTTGDPVKIYDDGGAKIKKCLSQMDAATNFGRGYYNAMAKIATDKYVVVYRDLAQSSYGYIRVFQFDANNVITMGTPVMFYNLSAYYIDVCAIDTDKCAIVYKGVSNYGYSVIATVVGTTVTLGTPVQFNSAYAVYNTCCKLDTDKYVVITKDAGILNHGVARVFTVLGTVISFGLPNDFSGALTSYMSCCQLDTDKFAVSYYASNAGRAIVATVVGTTMTFGVVSTFNAAPVYSTYIAKIATDKIGVIYRDGGDSHRPNMRVAGITGTVIGTWGIECTFHVNYGYYSAIARLEDDKFVAIVSQDSIPYSGSTYVCSVSGTTISVIGSKQIFSNARVYYVDIVGFSADKYAFVYYDASAAAVACTIVIDGDLNTIPLCAGLLTEGGAVGETKIVDLVGCITEVLSSLTPGMAYYIHDDGSITKVNSVYLIGLAVGTDELLLTKSIVGG